MRLKDLKRTTVTASAESPAEGEPRREGFYDRAVERARSNPYRRMYGGGTDPQINPAMAAAAQAAPEAVAHGTYRPTDGDRSYGGQGVFGQEQTEEERDWGERGPKFTGRAGGGRDPQLGIGTVGGTGSGRQSDRGRGR